MPTTELPNQLCREISQQELAAYYENGAAAIRGVVPRVWIELMQKAVDRILVNPGSAAVEYTPKEKEGRYLGDFFILRRDPDFQAFMMDSPLPELAAQVMGSTTVHFFYDQLLVKEPKTEEPTPWHHDLPYWPVRGRHIMSVWVPFDPVNLESGAVVYVKGSHKWGKMYAPASFAQNSGFADIYAKMGLEPVPDIEANKDQYELLHWDLEPGDVIIHHPVTLHYAPGNASPTGRRRGLALRYLGDDAVWDARPGTFIENPKVRALLPPLEFQDGERIESATFPRVWPR